MARRGRRKSSSSSSDDDKQEGGGDFVLRVSSFHCRPEDLRVRLSGRTVVVEGKGSDVRDEADGSPSSSEFSSSVRRHFSRSATLPADCDPESLRAEIDQRSGELVVTAKRDDRRNRR